MEKEIIIIDGVEWYKNTMVHEGQSSITYQVKSVADKESEYMKKIEDDIMEEFLYGQVK
jgi:hypothetical protein